VELAGHIKVLSGPLVARGPDVAQACPRPSPLTPFGSMDHRLRTYVQMYDEHEKMGRKVEEGFLVFAVPGSWFYLIFFAG